MRPWPAAVQTSLFTYGFRPFFLGTGMAGLLLVPAWAASFTLGWPLATSWPPMLWHAHEMLFGFVCTAIAGFLLTSVPSWTGQKGFAGRPLMSMTALWLLGRVLVGSSAFWPSGLVAAVDLAFLPALGALIGWPLVRERNRNTPLLLVLFLLWSCNAAFHVALWRNDPALARQALLAGINLALILVTVIGGRITPSFTATALRQRGVDATVRSRRAMTPIVVGLMVAVAAIDLVRPGSALAGAVALAAAAAQAARLAQWQGHRTLRDPIVWVLHAAYAWLPIGLALKSMALLAGVAAAAFWMHALTIGALATMILGVMTRVSLGHTGRTLQLHRLTVLAYLLLSTSVLVRVFGAAGAWPGYTTVIAVSAALWTAAFAAFLWVYAPILLAPRVTGRSS